MRQFTVGIGCKLKTLVHSVMNCTDSTFSSNSSFNRRDSHIPNGEGWKQILDSFLGVVFITAFGIFFLLVEILAFLVVLQRYKSRRVISTHSFVNLHISLFFAVLSPTSRLIRQLNVFPCNSGPWGCGLCGVVTRTLISIYPFTMIIIFFELAQSSRDSRNPYWIVLSTLPWVTAIVISLPVFYTYSYIPAETMDSETVVGGTCVRVLLMDSRVISLGYECISVFLRFIVPSTYMFYGMRKVGFRLRYLFLCNQIPECIGASKIRRVRFVFCHMLIFVLTWVPVGVFNLVVVLTKPLPTKCPIPVKPDKIVGIPLSIMFLMQLTFQPFFYFRTVYDTPLSEYFHSIMSALGSNNLHP